jgi:hypothetical protein
MFAPDPQGPLLTVLVFGGAFLLLENEPKLVLLLMLLLLGLLGILGCARLGRCGRFCFLALVLHQSSIPQILELTDASELLGGGQGICLSRCLTQCLLPFCKLRGRIPAALRRRVACRTCTVVSAGFLVLTGVSFP